MEDCSLVTFRLRVLRINSTRSLIDFSGWVTLAAGAVEFESSSAATRTGTRANPLAKDCNFFIIPALPVEDVRILKPPGALVKVEGGTIKV